MENVIKKAIEGGFKPKYTKQGLIWSKTEQGVSYLCPHGTFEHYVLDPLFWQALGKACWIEICTNPDHSFIDAMGSVQSSDIGRLGCPLCGHNEDHVIPSSKLLWKKHALSFHEINLTEGWSKACEYLESITK